MNAAERFRKALDALDHVSERVPCRDLDPRRAERWTSDDHDDLEWAAFHCVSLRCPLIELCGAFADEIKAKHHTWAGAVRTPKPKRKAA